jgi:hypothetical protein
MRTLERKLRPVTRFIAKVESVSEQAGHMTDPGPTKDVASPPATPTESKSTVENTQDWLFAIATVLMVTYFLLAAGPSLLVKIETTRGARALNTRLLQKTTISGDPSRYFATVTLINLLLGIATTAPCTGSGCPTCCGNGRVFCSITFPTRARPRPSCCPVVAVVSFGRSSAKPLPLPAAILRWPPSRASPATHLVGRRSDVSPLVVFLSLWFGGWLRGVAVALAVPLLVTAKALSMGIGGLEAAEAAGPARDAA